jgi:hypothetical protein
LQASQIAESVVTEHNPLQQRRNLSPDAGFELQWKYSLYQTGFDKTVMESSLPASLVLRQVKEGVAIKQPISSALINKTREGLVGQGQLDKTRSI